jgi:CDP-diacylglycerol--glycerol-3-phosphate 3-phosphatidyltransferase
MKAKIPMLLIYSRLVMGILIVLLSIWPVGNFPIIATVLLTAGLLSDVFDGIIARRLNVSTQKLRRLDSSVDQVFFIGVAVATYIHCPEFFKAHVAKLVILLAAEALTYVVSFVKFRKEVATHSIGAKMWTLLLFGTLVQLIWQCDSHFLFESCFWIGMLTRLEIVAIILTLRNWTNDVPSLYHAIRLRQGKSIKRNKLFNG